MGQKKVFYDLEKSVGKGSPKYFSGVFSEIWVNRNN